jgi:hypothetical protein
LILVWFTIAAILDLIRVKIQRQKNDNDRSEITADDARTGAHATPIFYIIAPFSATPTHSVLQ